LPYRRRRVRHRRCEVDADVHTAPAACALPMWTRQVIGGTQRTRDA
jgi:hypothetical protein